MRWIARLILLGCLGWLAYLGLTPDVRSASVAATRYGQWQSYWQEQPGPAAAKKGRRGRSPMGKRMSASYGPVAMTRAPSG